MIPSDQVFQSCFALVVCATLVPLKMPADAAKLIFFLVGLRIFGENLANVPMHEGAIYQASKL